MNTVHPLIAETRAARTMPREACANPDAESVAHALRQCVGVAKEGAAAAGVDPSRFRHWWNGDRNPVADVASFIAALGKKAVPLIVLFYSLCLRRELRGMTDLQLVAAFWKSFDQETDLEAKENRAKELYGRSGDLRAIRDATRIEATEEMKLSAIIDELLERRIDPRTLITG